MNRIQGMKSATLEIKKSVFTATVLPMDDESLIGPYLNQEKLRFPKSNHIVYAYHLNDGMIQRQSDDGEPKGTAGMPVLEAIHHYDITNVLVTVRRDFGGILLGAGGLIRAYSKAAHLALKECDILIPKKVYAIVFTLDYKSYDQAQSFIHDQLNDIHTEYGIGVDIQGTIETESYEAFKAKIQSILNDTPDIKILEEKTTFQPNS